jgi:1-acyl-sn-glycerol-3-phosphate acyltransferase
MISAEQNFQKNSSLYFNSVGVLKFWCFLLLIAIFIICQFMMSLLPIKNKYSQGLQIKLTAYFASIANKILNLKIKHEQVKLSNGLILTNHVSYIDILVILSHYPSFFVTSVEIKNSSFLGTICKLANCIFVERRKNQRHPNDIHKTVREISKKLFAGQLVCIFPEGTTSDGSTLLPFKYPLLKAAEITRSPVHHFAIKYNSNHLKSVTWYGDMKFLPHLFNLCCQPLIEVDLKYLSQSCILPNADLKVFAAISHHEIRKYLFN